MSDDLDLLIDDLAKEVGRNYPFFENMIVATIKNNKSLIRLWLKRNKSRLLKILKTV